MFLKSKMLGLCLTNLEADWDHVSDMFAEYKFDCSVLAHA